MRALRLWTRCELPTRLDGHRNSARGWPDSCRVVDPGAQILREPAAAPRGYCELSSRTHLSSKCQLALPMHSVPRLQVGHPRGECGLGKPVLPRAMEKLTGAFRGPPQGPQARKQEVISGPQRTDAASGQRVPGSHIPSRFEKKQ